MGSYGVIKHVAGCGDMASVSGVATTVTGISLGDEIWQDGIKYRLSYNAGNSQINPGYVASPLIVGGGSSPYSVTISFLTGTYANIGAVVVHNATATTGTHFWGAVRGYLASGLVASATTLQTGYLVAMGTNGTVDGITNLSSGATVIFDPGKAIGFVVNGPTAGTVAVRQGSVYIKLD